jgi:hypothetical protein
MVQATPRSSSGESIVSIQHLVCVTMCRWPSSVQVGRFLSALHTRRSPTQSDMYQMLYWYNWFSWWWARGCSKHVEKLNKCKRIVRQVGYLQATCLLLHSFQYSLTYNYTGPCTFYDKMLRLKTKKQYRQCTYNEHGGAFVQSWVQWKTISITCVEWVFVALGI